MVQTTTATPALPIAPAVVTWSSEPREESAAPLAGIRAASASAPELSGASPTATAADAETALVARLRAGDPAAFEELVRQHGPRMLALARRYLPREADAEDTLQDAFLSVFRFVRSFAGDSRLTTWLHRITVNAALMKIRSQNRRPGLRIDEFHADALPVSTGGDERGVSASEALTRAETRDVVRQALDRLHQESRIVVRLRDIEGLDLQEISRLLGVGVSTVKSRLRRGRLALREILDAHLGTEPR